MTDPPANDVPSLDSPAEEVSPEGKPPEDDPGYARVLRFLNYSLSLPERALRSGAGVAAGALRESAALLVPQAFQTSTSYEVFVRQMLNFLAEDVGGVEKKVDPNAEPDIENFVARKAVGNFIELAGLATIHLSPMVVLAVVSDAAYGSQAYLRELADELKQQGVIDENSTVDGATDLLEAVRQASGTTAKAFNTPPLSVDGLKQTIDETRRAVAAVDPTTIIPKAEMDRMWGEMKDVARREDAGLLEVSGAMTLYALGKMDTVRRGALSTVTVTGRLFDRHVIGHYRGALADIQQRGLYASVAETSRPYVDAVWQNFSTEKTTITEEILSGRLVGGTWRAMRHWLGGGDVKSPSER